MDRLWGSENLFGPVTAVSLAVLRKQGPGWKQDAHGRYAFKHMLMKRLVGQRRDREKIRTLLWFLDWLVSLPEPLKLAYAGDINEALGEDTMRFKSTLEEVAEMEGEQRGVKIGEQRGLQKGRQEGEQRGVKIGEQRGLEKGHLTAKQDILIRLVQRRFGVTQDDERVIRDVADPQALDAAIDAVIDAESKDQVLALLPSQEQAYEGDVRPRLDPP